MKAKKMQKRRNLIQNPRIVCYPPAGGRTLAVLNVMKMTLAVLGAASEEVSSRVTFATPCDASGTAKPVFLASLLTAVFGSF